MKFHLLYCIGNKSHITGNEEVLHIIFDTQAELIEFKNRRDVIPMNSWGERE